MTEKIKSALLKWAEKVINQEGHWDDEKTHQTILWGADNDEGLR